MTRLLPQSQKQTDVSTRPTRRGIMTSCSRRELTSLSVRLLPVRVREVLAATADSGQVLARRVVNFLGVVLPAPGVMATDSWALAVDEQEAAVKSVSGFSFRGANVAGPRADPDLSPGSYPGWAGLWPTPS